MTKNKESTKYLSEIQEINIARAVGGKRTPMSGAGMFFKSDILTQFFSIEAKTQMKPRESFSIKKEWISKLKEETFQNGRPFWALAFNFGGEENQKENYYVISEKEFLFLKERLEEECR